ncbi:hypothetical protein [[Eubacterium] cellulosolvens]
MGVRAGIIECPHCGNHLQDTKQEYIDCRFCGKRFKRGMVGKEKEEAMRRDMIMDLSDTIQKRKVVIFAGKVFGFLFLLLTLILMFSEAFTIEVIILTVLFLANGLAWIGIASVYNSKLQKEQSKMFDLSGGRTVFEY